MSSHHRSFGAWIVVTTLQALMALAQGLTALLTGSVALFAETLHLVGDVTAAVVGVRAERQSQQQPDQRASFGYSRVRDRSFSFRAILIMVLGYVALMEVASQIFKPEPPVMIGLALVVATIGLIMNIVGHVILERFGHDHNGHDHGSASDHRRLFSGHLLWDAASSLVAIVSLSLVHLSGSFWIDIVGGLAIGLGMAVYGQRQWSKESVVNRELELMPGNFPRDVLLSRVLTLPGVTGLDHLHVWDAPQGIRAAICIHVDGHTLVDQTELIRQHIHGFVHQPPFLIEHIWIEFRSDAEFFPASKLS